MKAKPKKRGPKPKKKPESVLKKALKNSDRKPNFIDGKFYDNDKTVYSFTMKQEDNFQVTCGNCEYSFTGKELIDLLKANRDGKIHVCDRPFWEPPKWDIVLNDQVKESIKNSYDEAIKTPIPSIPSHKTIDEKCQELVLDLLDNEGIIPKQLEYINNRLLDRLRNNAEKASNANRSARARFDEALKVITRFTNPENNNGKPIQDLPESGRYSFCPSPRDV